MKLKLKLTSDELRYLESKTILVDAINSNEMPKEKKLTLSIMIDVSEIVYKAAKILNRQLSLESKKHSVSLKWHEAEILEIYLEGFTSNETDYYRANMARKIISQINQKLA